MKIFIEFGARKIFPYSLVPDHIKFVLPRNDSRLVINIKLQLLKG